MLIVLSLWSEDLKNRNEEAMELQPALVLDSKGFGDTKWQVPGHWYRRGLKREKKGKEGGKERK